MLDERGVPFDKKVAAFVGDITFFDKLANRIKALIDRDFIQRGVVFGLIPVLDENAIPEPPNVDGVGVEETNGEFEERFILVIV